MTGHRPGEPSRPLYDPELSADRIRAARQVADAAGEPFVLVGRTDVLLTRTTRTRIPRPS
ncbi:hypothetical protein [Streptomyces humi]